MKDYRTALLATALLASASLECAAVEPLDTFSARIGGYVTEFDTELRADGQTEEGTRLDFQRDLGLDESNTIAIVGLTWRPFDRHEFGFNYYQDDADASRVTNRTFEFDGTTYETNSTIRSEFDLDAYEAYYVYWAVSNDRWALGPRVGLLWYSMELSVTMELDANGNPVGSGQVSESVDADLPAPTIGGSWRWVPGGGDWRMSADVGYFSADVNDIDADVTFGRLGVEWFPWESVGVSLDYTARKIEADADTSSFTGNLDFIDSGLRLGVTYRF
ncbi:MAG TPA: hypothetical protein VGD42_11705 [Lysobacter sp.]